MPDRPKVSPYNFVPLAGRPERSPYPGIDRLAPDGYSGTLACELEAVTRLFTADHRNAKRVDAGGGKQRTLFRFLRSEAPEAHPILQGSSLRGMVRSVYEAATNSCLPLAAVTGTSLKAGQKVEYRFTDLGEHQRCRSAKELCPACRLFGVIEGDEVHARGRVAFSDAVLAAEDKLETTDVPLAELSGPKPHHGGIYGKDGTPDGPIAGRKLYYHHEPRSSETATRSFRANDIAEYAPPGARFRFSVSFQNLTLQELGDLRHCLALEPNLGHKIGMAKPLGFGSCIVRLRESECAVHRGGGRYRQWRAAPQKLADLSLEPGPFPEPLRELLRIDKHERGIVGYLGWRGYQGARLDRDGRYVFPQQAPPRPRRSSSAAEEPRSAVENKPLAGALASAFKQTQKKPGARSPAKIRRGEKIKVLVTAREGDECVLLVKKTGQKELRFRPQAPWHIGQTYNVKVKALDNEGRVAEVTL